MVGSIIYSNVPVFGKGEISQSPLAPDYIFRLIENGSKRQIEMYIREPGREPRRAGWGFGVFIRKGDQGSISGDGCVLLYSRNILRLVRFALGVDHKDAICAWCVLHLVRFALACRFWCDAGHGEDARGPMLLHIQLVVNYRGIASFDRFDLGDHTKW